MRAVGIVLNAFELHISVEEAKTYMHLMVMYSRQLAHVSLCEHGKKERKQREETFRAQPRRFECGWNEIGKYEYDKLKWAQLIVKQLFYG